MRKDVFKMHGEFLTWIISLLYATNALIFAQLWNVINLNALYSLL